MAQKIGLIIIFLLLTSCEPEKYWGSQLEGEALLETARISGQVTNFYTAEGVSGARLKFAETETAANIYGFYYLNYILSEDELRNKPVPVTITANNYYPHSDILTLNSADLELNYVLKYGAPLILRKAFVPANLGLSALVQAEVLDYQGAESITEVMVRLYQEKPQQGYEYYPMRRLGSDNTLSANYSVNVPFSVDYKAAGFEYHQSFDLIVVDNEAFDDTVHFGINLRDPDVPIFPISD